MASIDTPDVLRALEGIWKTKAITADRTRVRIEQVIDWAIVRGHRSPGTNPARWRGHLSEALPPPRQLAPIEHHKAMDYRLLPAFMVELRAHDGVAARALEFLILTAARSGEVTGATWDEIDLNSKTWIIPAHRTKSHREHRVPLSSAALDLLRRLPHQGGQEWVFVTRQSRLNKMALPRVMKVLEQAGLTTVHGFRSSFRDWAGETTAFPHDVCEAALAHVRGDQTIQAYARGDLFIKRRALMQEWARHCSMPPAKASGDVVALRGRR